MKYYQLPRVTYIQQPDDLSPFHQMFDEELPKFQSRLGAKHGNWIGGAENWNGDLYPALSPIDSEYVLGQFVEATSEAVDDAVRVAAASIPKWGKIDWRKRVAILRRAAEVFSQRRFELSMAVLYEVGKSRMQAVSEIEEAIDFLHYYSEQFERNNGYQGPDLHGNKREVARNQLLPYGVFAVISPFNYPVALSMGMMTAALLAGNSVVWKPSPYSGLSASLVASCFEEAGLPAGVLNIVHGSQAGPLLCAHDDVDGFAFTGSYEVGMTILRNVANGRFMRPVLAEMGGKNHAYVSKSADVDAAVSGVVASAFGMEGQKCTACSVALVHDSVYNDFVERSVARTKSLRERIGNVEEQKYLHGPLINEASFLRYQRAAHHAAEQGRVLTGGNRIFNKQTERGYFVEHMIVDQLAENSYLLIEEQFAPVLAIAAFSSLDEAITRGNRSQYGLTCGFYGSDQQEIDVFTNKAEAGLLYINRQTGATTGAWPGLQSFCGWKGSGVTGKGGLGPHYVAQFMREQNQTRKLAVD